MKHTCAKCNETITFGKKVVQMMRGPWKGRITPGFHEVFAEWHWPECFGNEFKLQPQALPYKCEECGKEINGGENVCFFVVGDETDEYSTFSESRGYEIFSVKHYPSCS
jgi:DNA-directed RNA polymerase subunit RPC12/RpoP